MAMQLLSSSSSSSLSNNFSYDVFISFRGTDTRHGFTGNLYKALCDKGIRTFIDDKELQRGDEITSSLHKKIQDSRISVIIFSENYATSTFCLDELVHIINCSKETGRFVLPVFYGVEPSHVRHLTNSYGEAVAEFAERFQNNKENMERLQKWKIALNQAANLSGFHYTHPEYEYKFIEKIVEDISNKTNRDFLHVAKYPVGLQSQVQQVKLLLDNESKNEVLMVGLYGAGGMGKSTLAKAIYNSIADQFEGSCFLEDVRENSTINKLKHLQEKILKIVRSDDQLGGVSEGVAKIKKKLCRKKILLILDDVDKPEQLEALAGGLDWFGPGSRVIITTRDKRLLTCHGIESMYPVVGLYQEEARKLFRLMAFKNGEVPSSYKGIFNRALTYASGLPLAIVTIGSNLFRRSIEDWERILDEYEKIPNKEIQRILKVSYDALEEKEKSVFLDIACCFKGCKWTKVNDILHAHYGHCVKHHVEVLVEKSLINHWKYDGYMTLHDLIEDMGKEVVRQQSPNLGGRSRLWFHDDIVQVLKENTGTENIEMIYLKCPSVENVIEWKGKAFKKMKNLKTLVIKNGHFSKGPEYLPSSLRFLKWKGYPSESLSSSVLNKTFEKMKILKIDNCEYLTNISDVSCLPNLETMSFKNCKSLVTIHDSIGYLSQLQILNATDCNKLLSFPPLKLMSLRKLKLSGCTNLKKFPEILGKMKNINEIILRKTGIEELPFSFHNLTGLTDLTIEGCGILKLPSSIFMMSNLFEVKVSGYSQLLPKPNDKLSSTWSSSVNVLRLEASNHEFLTIALMWFSNVVTLHLSDSNIKILPECLEKCLSIKCIDLDDCKTLEEIRGIPPNLKALSALRCKSLTSSSKSMLMSQELHEAGSIECCFPSSPSERIPEWFEHQTKESISFSFRNNLPSLVFLFSSKVVSAQYLYAIKVNLIINDDVYSSGIGLERDHTYLFPFNVEDWYLEEYHKFKSMLDDALLKNEWIHAEVRFCDWGKEYDVESGIHVIKHLTNMDDFQFTDSFLGKNIKRVKYPVMKLPSGECISQTPPRYRVLRSRKESFLPRLYYYGTPTIMTNYMTCSHEDDPNGSSIM